MYKTIIYQVQDSALTQKLESEINTGHWVESIYFIGESVVVTYGHASE